MLNCWMKWIGGSALIAGAASVSLAEEPHAHPHPEPPAASQPAAPVDPATAPRMEISAVDWDFGTVWQGEPLEKKFTIKNVGKSDLTLSLKSSCGCTVPTKPKSPLPPGEETTFDITYNTKKRKGAANQTVTLTTNDPDKKVVQIRVHGDVKELIKLEPQDGIYFGQLYENSAETKSVKLTSQVDDKLDLKIKPGQDLGIYDIQVKELVAGKEYEVTATTKPPLEVNSPKARAEVVLETGVPKMSELTVQVHAVILPPVQVRPTRLYVPRNLSSKLTRSIRITYVPSLPLKILEVKSDLPTVKAEVAPNKVDAPGQTVAYHEIIVTVESSGGIPEEGGKITVKTDSNDPRYKELEIPVKIVARTPEVQMPTSAPAGAPPPGTQGWTPVGADDVPSPKAPPANPKTP